MGALVDQLIEACRDYSHRTASPEWSMAAYLLYYSGGETAPNVPLHGLPSLDHAREWLEELIERRRFEEEFLTRALTRRIEDDFEEVSENYAVALRRRREVLRFAEDFAAANDTPGEQLDHIRALAVGSLEEMRRRRVELVAWRESAAPLLDR